MLLALVPFLIRGFNFNFRTTRVKGVRSDAHGDLRLPPLPIHVSFKENVCRGPAPKFLLDSSGEVRVISDSDNLPGDGEF